MRVALKVLLGTLMVFALTVSLRAEKKEDKKDDKDKKEVTLKGTITCAKCDLGESKECQTCIKTKIDGKEVVVYFDDKGKGEKYHGKVCSDSKPGSVTGVLSEKDKKKFITPSKDGVKFD